MRRLSGRWAHYDCLSSLFSQHYFVTHYQQYRILRSGQNKKVRLKPIFLSFRYMTRLVKRSILCGTEIHEMRVEQHVAPIEIRGVPIGIVMEGREAVYWVFFLSCLSFSMYSPISWPG